MTHARLTPRLVLTAWRGITRKQIAATFLLGLALFLYHVPTGLATGGGLLGLWVVFAADQIKVFPLLLAFAVAEQFTDRDQDRRGAYLIAAILGTVVAAPLAVTWVSGMFNLFLHAAQPRVGFMIYIGLETAMLGAAILWIVNDRHRAERAQTRMHTAGLERIAAEKRSVESDLQALQARVEPQFLFNTLAQVKRLYGQDPMLAEQMLDDLIAYLRAAMPRMRDTSSTVWQELELSRAYLDIVKVRHADRLGYAIEAPKELRHVRFPPMMLLPLIDHATALWLDDSDAKRSIRIVVEASEELLRLTIADSEKGFEPEAGVAAIEGIRERLTALFGDSAGIELSRSAAEGTKAVVKIPLEAADVRSAAGIE